MRRTALSFALLTATACICVGQTITLPTPPLRSDSWSYIVSDGNTYPSLYPAGSAVIVAYHGPAGMVEIPSELGGYPVRGVDPSLTPGLGYFGHPPSIFEPDSGAITSITIPDSVTTIGSGAFANCTSLSGLIIPESVTSIGSYAFSSCTSLASVNIPDNVRTIGDHAFSECISLTSVTIPDSVTTFSGSTFAGCASLISVTIGSGVTNIVSSTSAPVFQPPFLFPAPSAPTPLFPGCTNLVSITVNPANETYSSDNGVLFDKNQTTLLRFPTAKLGAYGVPASVTSIGNSAFAGCTGLTSVTLGNGVTTIGNFAFSGSTRLNSVTIGNNVATIGDSAFSGCTDLTSVTIPDSVTTIGGNAFSGCTGLNSVALGNGVTTIGDSAFSGCTGLASVTIPDTVTTIGGGALSGCTSLTSITIGSGVTNLISWYVFPFGPGVPFSNCPRLASITVDPANQTYSSIDGVLFNKDQSTLIQFPTARSGSYAIPTSVSTIGSSAFSGCTSLTSVTIPNSVTNLGSGAFFGCTSLTSVIIPNSVTSLGSDAFSGCTNLTSVTIGSGVNSLPLPSFNTFLGSAGPFSNCPRLVSFIVDPENQTYSSIDGVLFDKNKTILVQFPAAKSGSYVIPDTVVTIGSSDSPFTIGSSVTIIGGSAFSGCTGLTSVTIPDSVKSIGSNAFSGCTSLTSVTIPNSVTSMGSNAFSGCTNLTSVTIGSGVTNLAASSFFPFGPEAPFFNCPSLASITVDPSNQTYSSIDGVLFNKDQTTLIQFPAAKSGSYAIPDSVTTVGSLAFSGSSGLTSVTIGSGVTSVGRGGSIFVPSTTPSFPGGLVTGINADLPAFSDCLDLAWIIVDPANQTYSSIDGVLFDKNKTTLIQFPRAKTGSYAVPDSVAEIGIGAFSNSVGLASLVIGSGVTSLGYMALDGCNRLNEILFKGAPPQNNPTALGSSATIYYLPEYASVWPPQFGGLHTALWAPKVAFATRSTANSFRFGWTGTGTVPMNVQRTTSLTQGTWTTIAAGVSLGDFTDFNPPQGTAFYRAVLP
jgi:hypothetical protein